MEKTVMDIISYILAKKYVDESLAGAGALKGVPCQIQDITPITGGNRITFLWEDNDGNEHTVQTIPTKKINTVRLLKRILSKLPTVTTKSKKLQILYLVRNGIFFHKT